MDTQGHGKQRISDRLNPYRFTPRYNIIKLSKVKDKVRNLSAARMKKRVTYKGTPKSLLEDISTETL